MLTGWLDAFAEDIGVPWERTVIGGFSQGSVMSYALALGAGRPSPAGLLVMSGFIPEVDGFELDLERPGLPIAITHGTLDPVISVEFARSARQRLEAAGNRLLYRESPVGHGIDPAVLPDLRAWLGAASSTTRMPRAVQSWKKFRPHSSSSFWASMLRRNSSPVSTRMPMPISRMPATPLITA